MSDGKSELPGRSKGDVAHAIAKAALSAVPIVGGSAVELFQLVIQPPLEKRRDEWMREVGERLGELEAKGLNLSALSENEQFVSAVLQASQAALRTHQAEKRAALKNAIVNVARGQAPEEAILHLLLSYVDLFSEMHLRVLKVFHDPKPPPGISMMGALSHVLEHNIPELRGHRELYDQLWSDLRVRGLVDTDGLHGMMTANGLTSRRTTELGAALLKLIDDSREH